MSTSSRKNIHQNDIEAIIHFAGSAVVPTSIVDPLAYYDNNTGKTRSLMSAAIKAGIRHFVFSSTAAVYGPQASCDPVSETAPLHPETPYGHSKLMSEMMLRDVASAYDFRYVALRYLTSPVPIPKAGPASRLTVQPIWSSPCEAALGKRQQVDIYGTAVRPMTEPACATTSTSPISPKHI